MVLGVDCHPSGMALSILVSLNHFPLALGKARVSLEAMSNGNGKKTARRKAMLLGVGLDSDGHKRITTGPNFALVGGSQETHEEMTEKAVKINEKLVERGKQLEEVSHDEFDDIAHSVGLRKVNPPQGN